MIINKILKFANSILIPTFKSTLSPHRDRHLQAAWNFTQLGVLIFPLMPTLGALGFFLALVGAWKQKFKAIVCRPINQGLAILGIWLVLTVLTAQYPLEALLGLANFLPYFILFAALSAIVQTPAHLRQLSWLLVIPSIPIVILGLGQQFLGWASTTELQGILGWVLEPKGNPPGRMASVFMYANILASYLTLVFPLGLGLWIDSWTRRNQREARKTNVSDNTALPHSGVALSNPNSQLAILTLALMGAIAALVLTSSRNAWGLAAFTGLSFALYLGQRILVAIIVGLTAGILGSAFGPDPIRQGLRLIVPAWFWARLTDRMYQNRPLATLRKTQWEFVWNLIKERPLTGWGLRNFTPLYEAQMHRWLGHPHNFFLMLTAEAGIPATLLLCGLVGWILAQAGLLLFPRVSIHNDEEGSEKDGSRERLILAPGDRTILFSYLLTFIVFSLFNTADVTLFDFRVNVLGWLVLAAIYGVTVRDRSGGWNRQHLGQE